MNGIMRNYTEVRFQEPEWAIKIRERDRARKEKAERYLYRENKNWYRNIDILRDSVNGFNATEIGKRYNLTGSRISHIFSYVFSELQKAHLGKKHARSIGIKRFKKREEYRSLILSLLREEAISDPNSKHFDHSGLATKTEHK